MEGRRRCVLPQHITRQNVKRVIGRMTLHPKPIIPPFPFIKNT